MDDKTITRIKNKIKNELFARNMSIYELAKRAGITDACIRNWYSKRNYEPSLSSICAVCKVLDISLSKMFMNDEETSVSLTKEEIEVIELWSKLSEKEKEAVLTIIKSYL